MTVDKYALMRVRLHKNYVWRHGRITNGHFEWLLVRGGIDDIMNLRPNGYEVKL